MSQTITQEKMNFTEEDIYKFSEGMPISEILGATPEILEAGYTLAYNYFTSGNYKDAQILFGGLIIYNQYDPRFFTGLALCRQAQNNLIGAIDAFLAAMILTKMKDPIPLFNIATCFLKLGDKEEALLYLDKIIHLDEDVNNKIFITKAKELQKTISK